MRLSLETCGWPGRWSSIDQGELELPNRVLKYRQDASRIHVCNVNFLAARPNRVNTQGSRQGNPLVLKVF